MTAKEMAWKIMDKNSAERKEAENAMGKPFEEMTIAERRLIAAVLAGISSWNKK